MVCNFCFSNSLYNKANIFPGLIEYELNSLLSASHLVDYISVHIRFDLERYLLNIGESNLMVNFVSVNISSRILLISGNMRTQRLHHQT